MARESSDSKEEPFDRMQILIRDIRTKNNTAETEESSVHIFHNIIRNLTQQNSTNMPPLLLTTEDRKQIQKDREKAIECEERLAKRRQEKYFDLVDKVQNVLKLIEKKNSKKHKVTESGICDTPDIEFSPNLRSPVSSDCNNNPSPKQSENFIEHTESLDSSCYSNRKLSAARAEGCPSQRSSTQGRKNRQKHNSRSRYSLPANFEDYHNCSYTDASYKVSDPVTNHSKRRPSSIFSDQPSMYQNSLPLADESTTRQTPVAQYKGFKTTWRGEAVSGTSFDIFNSSHMSSESPSAIKTQRESLLLEQKRLEDHFNTLQGKLLAEFQQQQSKLFEMYKGSMESQPEPEISMHSVLERSYESAAVETIGLNNSDKENYRESNIGELSKSPFSLGPRKASNGSQKSTPNSGLTVIRSFNSEASLHEFYDISRFGVKASGEGTVEQRESRDEMEEVEEKSQIFQKTDRKFSQNFGSTLSSSPKWTPLNGSESQTKEMIDAQHHQFCLVSAYAKGFFTRHLFQTEKVVAIITTLKDAKNVLNEMKSETSQSMTDRSLMERVKTQLKSAQSKLCKIFLEVSPRVRMEIIQQNRKLLKEKQARNENKVVSKVNSQTRPKLSNATMKKRLSRQQLQEKPLKCTKTATPSPSAVIKTTARSNERATSKNIAKIVKKKESEVSTGKTTCVITTTRITSAEKATSSLIVKKVSNKYSSRATKPSSKVTVDPTKRRRTWDTGVLKPIQGRISPALPDKRRVSGDKKQPISSLTARKIDQKVKTDHQTRGTRGASGTVGNSRVNSKTFKVDNRHVTRTGARRSLAANLSNK